MIAWRNCGERARDGRGLVAALWWRFLGGGAGTEPPKSPARRGRHVLIYELGVMNYELGQWLGVLCCLCV